MKKNSIKLSILFVLIATALWFVGSWWHYACKIKNTCGNNENTVASSPISSLQVIDTDKDGLSDIEEEKLSSDPLLVDTDGDSIPDKEEAGTDLDNPLDTDGDGIIDILDKDDDDDGVSTLIEERIGTSSLLVDTDGDGLLDGDEIGSNSEKPLDTDGDRIIDALDTDDDDDNLDTRTELLLGTNPLLADSDGDGISDGDEIGDLMDTNKTPLDSDSDGTIDALDTEDNLDQDGDGLSDQLEAILNTNPKVADTDGDGINDSIEVGDNTNEPLDSDLDGIIDALDTTDDRDSDNDGLTDAQEAKLKSNPHSVDSDNDGINDNEEIGSNIDDPLDSDNDGILNLNDKDDDNDGLFTLYEIEVGTNPLAIDTDNDGLSDKAELTNSDGNIQILDSDNDGMINAVDSDDDNDGLMTSVELSLGTDPMKEDTDGDGILDGDEVGSDTNNPNDIDNDGIPDVLDVVNDNKKPEIVIIDSIKEDSTPETVVKNTEKTIKENVSTLEDSQQLVTSNDSLTIEAIEGDNSDGFQASRIYFPPNSFNPVISKESSTYFDSVIKWMKFSAENNISLIGHTDNIGSKKANLAMGIRRVMLIREILLDKGAPIQQIDVMSRGEAEPIADNTTDKGRLKNRRVEIAPMRAEF